MHRFRWLGAGEVPAAYDLRRRGWALSAGDVGLTDLSSPHDGPTELTLAVGIPDPAMRARLLLAGFGDALGSDPELSELEARALRVAERVPRYRRCGLLELDLVARDAFVAGQALCLHPREFELLWRLMAARGEAVSKAQLLREVWNLRHVPETNSLAVHACRLRTKLGAVGLAGLVVTEGDGYRFLPQAGNATAVPLHSPVDSRDHHLRLTDDPPLCESLSA